MTYFPGPISTIVSGVKQGIVLMGRNTTGPPRAAPLECCRRRQTKSDANEQNNTALLHHVYCVGGLASNNGSYSTADNRRSTTVTNTFVFTSSRVCSWWCSLNRSRRAWTSLRAERVATRYSTLDTLKWTLYLWLNITLHWLLQKSTIVQSLVI